MKRSSSGMPVGMTTVERWKEPNQSCQLCRSKKLRCDRSKPCSNCSSRGVECKYAGSKVPAPQHDQLIDLNSFNNVHVSRDNENTTSENDIKAILQRLTRLENTVFTGEKEENVPPNGQSNPLVEDTSGNLSPPSQWTSFSAPSLSISTNPRMDRGSLSQYLPPRDQSIQLLEYFAKSIQPTFGVLHVPSTIDVIERTYVAITADQEPDAGAVLLIIALCGSCALAWTPELMNRFDVKPKDARDAFRAYCSLFTTVLERLSPPLEPSIIALEALLLITHLLTNTDGRLDTIYTLQARALWMTRVLQINYIDTPNAQRKRAIEGADHIQIEVQRRIWWYMVAADWLSAFSSGPLQGTYSFLPAQMCVKYPSNADDKDITSVNDVNNLPLSTPTSMSHFIHELRLAELCREAVDNFPPSIEYHLTTRYELILSLHAKFQNYIEQLPVYFRFDSASLQESEDICRQRPYIAWQRALLHFTFNTRLCRLHRPFHLEGFSNPEYAFSRATCTRSAQLVLEMRRLLEVTGPPAGLQPAFFCLVVQHVCMAAVILATEVSLNPSSPGSAALRAEVLAVCDMLEISKRESLTAREYIESHIYKFKQLLKSNSKARFDALGTDTVAAATPVTSGIPTRTMLPQSKGFSHGTTFEANSIQNMTNLFQQPGHAGEHGQVVLQSSEKGNDPGQRGAMGLGYDGGDTSWDQIWTDFFDAAPDFALPQWNMIYDGVASTFRPTH